MLKKKMRVSILAKLRNYFITGVVVLIPIGITLYLTLFVVKISSKILPREINPNHYLPFSIPGLEIVITLILITMIGGLSLSFLGSKLVKLVDGIFEKIPFLRTIYFAIGQMTENFAKNTKNKRKSVVLVEYPRKGSWAVGFVTQTNEGEIKSKVNEELVNVFVPTTPNPTSGFLLMFPKKEVLYLEMSFEEASKFIVSAGTINPKKN
tara:strand:+ start:159 stop:782 length:624 start_codon:yes stop_codon:yes gene_type:complete